MDRRLRILILGEIVTQVFQGGFYVSRPQEVGPCGFQNRSDFIGQRGILKKVGSFGAGGKLDALAFAQAGQCLQGLPHEDDAPLRFLLFCYKVGQFLLGGFISLLIVVGIGHGGNNKQV
jgi:hypothetical protein